MTRTQFQTEHGTEYRKLMETPMFSALLSVMDSESPAKTLHSKQENDKLHGAVVFLNEIGGWEKAHRLLRELGDEATTEYEPPTTFRHEEEI